MATEKDNGGPAFPRSPSLSTNGQQGMSLRDYFAGHAITALRLRTIVELNGAVPFTAANAEQQLQIAQMHAAYSYALADAMLKERAK